MPEGPTIVLMKEHLKKMIGQKVRRVSGNADIDNDGLIGKKLQKIRLYGKQTYLVFDDVAVRIHLLMFGSFEVDQQTKPDRQLRLGLSFEKGKMFFYTCSVKMVDNDILKSIDWEADVMSDDWNPKSARKKLKDNPNLQVCDALMDQDIFGGVGNIIKNEVLFRIGVHPESLMGSLPAKQISDLLKESRSYSFDFLKWKRTDELKKHWQIYHKKKCPKCGEPVTKKKTGKGNRPSFFCEKDQRLY